MSRPFAGSYRDLPNRHTKVIARLFTFLSLRAKRGNLMALHEIASADFVSLAMTEKGVPHNDRNGGCLTMTGVY
jgi:hypothetical protein